MPPGDGSAEILCTLEIHDRHASPNYEALSYTWGDSARSATIWCNARELAVTENCRRALKALRSRNASGSEPSQHSAYSAQPPKLWVDAICINRGNFEERSGQVSIMGHIFHSAVRTIVYLGELHDTNNQCAPLSELEVRGLTLTAIEEARRVDGLVLPGWQRARPGNMLKLSEMRMTVRKPGFTQSWRRCFRRAWFSRAWVLQEVVLSADVQVLIEDIALDWRAVEVFARIPEESLHGVEDTGTPTDLNLANMFHEIIWRRPLVVGSGIKWPVMWDAEHEQNLRTNFSNGAFEQVVVWTMPGPDSRTFLGARTLFELLERSASLECRDPRDKLYSLLSLFGGELPHNLVIDYSKPVRQVYLDLTWYLISHGVMEALSAAKGLIAAGSASLPSWGIDWTCHPRPRRLALDPFASIPARRPVLHAIKVVIKRTDSALVLRGRLLQDPVAVLDDKLTSQVPWFQGFTTESGIGGFGGRRLRPGDFPCLFHCYDMPLLLRRSYNEDVTADGWQLVGECWLQYDTSTCKRPAYDMDWSETFPNVPHSEAQDIWIY